MDVTLYTKRYTQSDAGIIELPAGSVWDVWAGAVTFKGPVAEVEKHLTIALRDTANKVLPVEVKMTTEEAEQFASRLLECIAKRKRLDSEAG